jgi:iron complex outermembrane receptor protein/vitamin B12 transporter
LPALAVTVSATLVPATGSVAFEEVRVTGSYLPGTRLTNAVAVLNREEIDALRKRSVVELLQTLPGVLVETQGGPGGLSAVSIRGGESNFTLVLLDGIAINDPTNTRGGSVDFGNLSADLVERIEVVKGAQSAIYGSDALAGVINIITRRPATGHQQRVAVQLGEDDFHDVGASASGRAPLDANAVHYVVDVQDRQSSDAQRDSQRENRSANLRVGWEGGNGHAVTASYRYLDGERTGYPEQSGGARFAVIDALDRSDYEQQTAALAWDAALTDTWTTRLAVSRFDFEEVLASPGISPFFEVPPLGSDTRFTRDLWQWSNTVALSRGVTLQGGLDLRDEDGRSSGFLEFGGAQLPTDFSLSRRTVGVFSSVHYVPVDALELQASARFDEPEDFGGETSVALGGAYALTSQVRLSANWGQAYKLPSFFALGHPLVGNPDLQPEQSETLDIGVRWQVSPAVVAEVVGFYNEFDDLIDFDDAAFINVNRKQVESRGVELQLLWQPSAQWSLRSQVTHTDLDVIDEDSILTGRPEWTGGVTSLWDWRPDLSVALDYRYTGNQYATSRHTGAAVTEKLDDFHRVDLTLRWQASPHWTLSAMLDNVLDEDYETAVGFPAPARAVRIGLRYTR